MMHVNFNKSIHFLLILLSLLVAGCSGTSEKPLSVSDQLPGDPNNDEANGLYGEHAHASSRLKFSKHIAKTAAAHKNTVWERLLSLYALPEIEHYRIDQEVNWYLQHPATLAIIQQRAEPYLHHILDEIEAKNIPGELALLPVVESAFLPDAYSHADASGLWQFVPSTGEEYGLQQNAWYDGRRDVYASTKAATTYLKELSETFDGDWLLALASYNCGKGRVRKSIEKNEERNMPTDYWSLSLPEETIDYVPRLLAIAKIFANAEEYNVHLQHIPNKPYFEVVDIKSPLDLRKAAHLANTPYDKFLKLNPGFNKSCTAPQGPHRLLVPADRAQSFKSNLAMLPYDERVDFAQVRTEVAVSPKRIENKAPEVRHDEPAKLIVSRYTVKRGETLGDIAAKNHTTASALRLANHLSSDTVRSGITLQIPSLSKPVQTAAVNSNNQKAASPSTTNQLYTVKTGDTFWNISQRFSVTPKEIADWNKISLGTALVPGKKLTIKSSNQQVASVTSSRLIQYTVGKGESLGQIAKKLSIPVGELQKSNADALSKGLRPGQKLKVLVDNRSAT